jgi:hypothetical protein
MSGRKGSLIQLGLTALLITVAAGVGYVIGGGMERRPVTDLAAVELSTPAPAETTPSVTHTTTPTTVAISTATPALAPTTTPTNVPTSLPDDATIFIRDDFSTTVYGWPQEETDTWSAGYKDGRYVLRLYGRTSFGFTTALPADNYRLSVDVAVTQGGAGVVFLFAEPGTTYRFLMTPDGAYSIERSDQQQQESIVTKVIDWTPHPALANDGGVNRLQIERRGNQIRFLVSDEEVTTFTVPEGATSNRYGFVLTARSGQAEAAFDNLLGERLP